MKGLERGEYLLSSVSSEVPGDLRSPHSEKLTSWKDLESCGSAFVVALAPMYSGEKHILSSSGCVFN